MTSAAKTLARAFFHTAPVFVPFCFHFVARKITMRFSPVAFGVCLVGALLLGSANSNVGCAVFADEPVEETKEEAKEPFVLDESVFDIEDGRNAEYYQEAEEKLRAEMTEFIAVTSAAERAPVFEKANAALFVIFKNRAFCEDLEEVERNRALNSYLSFLADDGKVDEINGILADEKAKETPDAARVAILETAIMRVEGKKRFAELVGNEMIVEGVYFEDGKAGEEIKWEDYRGKVVLVDFWATWCGPCVGEIPNVLALYEKYHDAGFEVLGYSLDSNLEALEKFEKERELPWKTASRKLSVEAEGKEYVNLTDYYGINAIPTMVLVGKDGKVLDTRARGEHLKELLEGLFPDVK